MRMFEAVSLLDNEYKLRSSDLDKLYEKMEYIEGHTWIIFEYDLLDYWVWPEEDDPFIDPSPVTDPYGPITIPPTPYISWGESDGTTITTGSSWITYTGNTMPSQLTVTGSDGETHVYTLEETSE